MIARVTERSGVEIDYCPKCRGVWLDRGELDKILERSSAVRHEDDSDDFEQRRPKQGERDSRRSDDSHRKPRKRGSSLGELFEFGD